ncbi:MAG: thiamine pyrophosphate-binding protein [Promethearchaeota archaeon]
MRQAFNILNGKPDKYTDKLHKIMKEFGINFATGVPCGVQKYIIYNFTSDPEIYHIPATRESEAIGIAAGAYLAGKKPAIYMQNSGLFSSSNDIASLLIPYKISVLLLVTWRGSHGEDAPQHQITGKATLTLLESMDIPYKLLKKDDISQIMVNLLESMEKLQFPVALLIQRRWNK